VIFVAAALGLTSEDVPEFHALHKRVAKEGEAVQGTSDLYGTRYIIDIELSRNGKTAKIRSCWIVSVNETTPRFVTCHILRKEREMSKLEYRSVVALLQDLRDKGLVRGQIGTVVELYSPTVGEVEFCDQNGHTYALETLSSDLMIRLHDRPLEQVA
jgi:Domain of unknown function (DUF4926)